MKQLKALEILKLNIIVQVLNEENRVKIKEAIAELEELIAKDKSKNCEECYNKTKLAIKALENRSCNGCKHLENREELLKHSCLIEVCRTCSRSNIDNWEQK